MLLQYLTLAFLCSFALIAAFIAVHLIRRSRIQSKQEIFRNELTQKLIEILVIEDTSAESITSQLQDYYDEDPILTGRVLIEYLSLLEGKEHEVVVEVFEQLGFIDLALGEYELSSLSQKLMYLSWLLYLNDKSYANVFVNCLDDKEKIVRVVGTLGVSKTCELETIKKSLSKTNQDLKNRFGLSCIIMSNIGKRFGAQELLSLVKRYKREFPDLARAGLIALVDLDVTSSLVEINNLAKELNFSKNKYLFEIDKKLNESNFLLGENYV